MHTYLRRETQNIQVQPKTTAGCTISPPLKSVYIQLMKYLGVKGKTLAWHNKILLMKYITSC